MGRDRCRDGGGRDGAIEREHEVKEFQISLEEARRNESMLSMFKNCCSFGIRKPMLLDAKVGRYVQNERLKNT